MNVFIIITVLTGSGNFEYKQSYSSFQSCKDNEKYVELIVQRETGFPTNVKCQSEKGIQYAH